MTTDIKLYNLSWQEEKTYLTALAFIAGNILFPQLCHALGVGHVLLPIYFFTLIGAYKYGLNVGILTAVLSPLVSHFLFGMPPTAMVPVVMMKSLLLATAAAFMAKKNEDVSLLSLLIIVIAYQAVGTTIEGLFFANSFSVAISGLLNCIPGLILQIVGGFLVLNLLKK